jgi:hypothetical protein
MNTINRVAAVGVVATFALFSTTSFALTMSGAGTSCLPDDDNDTFYRDSGGGFRNSSGGNRDIHCPIFLDRTYDQLTDLDVYVDLPTGTSVTCYLRALTNTGSEIDSDTGTTSSDVVGADVDFDAITFGTAYGTFASLRCSLPDAADIVAYTWTQG